MLFRIDNDGKVAKKAAIERLGVARNRVYVIFFDFKGRETERLLDPTGNAPWELDTITAAMERIAATRPIGRSRGEVFAAMLASDDVRLRREGATGFRTLGKDAAPHLARLLAALGDDDWIVRIRGCEALGRTGTAARAAIPAIVGLFETDPKHELTIALALARVDPGGENGFARLRQMLAGGRRNQAIVAAIALGEAGERGVHIVPDLMRALDHDAPYVRLHAIRSLAKLGPIARTALPRLTRLAATASQGKPNLRAAAADAVRKVRAQR